MEKEELDLSEQVTGGSISRVVRVLAILLIGFAIISLALFNSQKTLADEVWNDKMTVGSMEAKNYFVQYSDLACPYCNIFSKNIHDNYDEFKSKYIEGEDILFEIRLTDFLYEYSGYGEKVRASEWGASAAYCAADEDRFSDYYYGAIDTLWNDFYSKGLGLSKTGPQIPEGSLSKEYFTKIGKKIGLGEEFEKCHAEDRHLEEIHKNAAKAQKIVGGGLPFFKFNSWTTNGFDTSWGWDYNEKYFESGLKSKK